MNADPLILRPEQALFQPKDSVGKRDKKNWKRWRRFHVQQSTEEIHRQEHVDDGMPLFFGVHGHIRKQLDYQYHSHYRKERQWLHDAAIEDTILMYTLLDPHDEPSKKDYSQVQEPWLILMTGTRKSPKHEIVDKLNQADHLRLRGLIEVDADTIREYLPEYRPYQASCSHERAERSTRKETGYIVETLIRACLAAGRNTLYHCGDVDSAWFRNTFLPELQDKYSAKIALFRARPTTPTMVMDFHERSIDAAVEALRGCVRFCCELWLNRHQELQMRGCALWTSFQSHFNQWQNDTTHSMLSPPPPPKRFAMQRRSSSVKRLTKLRRSSLVRSTEDNHAADDMAFYGQFAHIRETLDYSYHKNYTHDRQQFQDAVIREFLDDAVITDKNGEVCTTPTEPWIVFTAGAMGAGKGYTMRQLVTRGRFPLFSFVRVDPDIIRRCLPEYALYLHSSPETAGQLTNKEAGYVAEIAIQAGLLAGKNVIVDGSLRNSPWYEEHFQKLRLDFPKLKIAILHITAPREAVFRRAAVRGDRLGLHIANTCISQERARETGRVVPNQLLEAALEAVPKSVKALSSLVDYQVDLRNVPDAPDIELVSTEEDWDSFTSRWTQYVLPCSYFAFDYGTLTPCGGQNMRVGSEDPKAIEREIKGD